jgi:murein DD-endopeptidase MepM/ murein hydrolase activator NlpD
VTFLRSGVGAEYHENFIVMKGRETNLVHKFMHTMRIGLTEGVSYQEGMVIGQSDCSGTDAAHCHWEVWKGGKQDGWSGGVIDPEEFYLKLYGIPYKHKEG